MWSEFTWIIQLSCVTRKQFLRAACRHKDVQWWRKEISVMLLRSVQGAPSSVWTSDGRGLRLLPVTSPLFWSLQHSFSSTFPALHYALFCIFKIYIHDWISFVSFSIFFDALKNIVKMFYETKTCWNIVRFKYFLFYLMIHCNWTK